MVDFSEIRAEMEEAAQARARGEAWCSQCRTVGVGKCIRHAMEEIGASGVYPPHYRDKLWLRAGRYMRVEDPREWAGRPEVAVEAARLKAHFRRTFEAQQAYRARLYSANRAEEEAAVRASVAALELEDTSI